MQFIIFSKNNKCTSRFSLFIIIIFFSTGKGTIIPSFNYFYFILLFLFSLLLLVALFFFIYIYIRKCERLLYFVLLISSRERRYIINYPIFFKFIPTRFPLLFSRTIFPSSFIFQDYEYRLIKWVKSRKANVASITHREGENSKKCVCVWYIVYSGENRLQRSIKAVVCTHMYACHICTSHTYKYIILLVSLCIFFSWSRKKPPPGRMSERSTRRIDSV